MYTFLSKWSFEGRMNWSDIWDIRGIRGIVTLPDLTYCGLMMGTRIWINIDSDGTKPLTEQMLTRDFWYLLQCNYTQKCEKNNFLSFYFIRLLYLCKVIMIWTIRFHRENVAWHPISRETPMKNVVGPCRVELDIVYIYIYIYVCVCVCMCVCVCIFHLFSAGRWNPGLKNPVTYLSCMVNIIGVDDKATEGAKVSAAMVLTLLSGMITSARRFDKSHDLTVNSYCITVMS